MLTLLFAPILLMQTYLREPPTPYYLYTTCPSYSTITAFFNKEVNGQKFPQSSITFICNFRMTRCWSKIEREYVAIKYCVAGEEL